MTPTPIPTLVEQTTSITTLLFSLLDVFKLFPINVIIVLALASLVFALFKKAKNAARG